MPRSVGQSIVHALTRSCLLPLTLGILCVVLIAVPVSIGNHLPGDLVDGRLNNYFLEQVYLRVTGGVTNFWDAPFFYPAKMTMAFSDNHIGDSPVYVLLRLTGVSREDAFGLWFAAGYVINFIAALYALERLGCSRFSAALGSFLFTFGLPITAQEGHAQLLYRFGVPLATLALVKAREQTSLRQLALAAFWTTWQFYCSIYIGYFLVLLLGALTLAQGLISPLGPFAGVRALPGETLRFWDSHTLRQKLLFLGSIVVLSAAMLLLLQPYIRAAHIYHFGRAWVEIADMLPRPVSYLYSLNSKFWPTSGPLFDSLPMRWEHAMFIGIAPVIAVAVALALKWAKRATLSQIVTPFALAWLILVILTLSLGGFTLYRPLGLVPGADAIRSVTRIGTVTLFPAGLIMAAAADAILSARLSSWLRGGAVGAVTVIMVLEASYIDHTSTPKTVWRRHMDEVAALLPAKLPDAPILMLGVRNGSANDEAQLDAMMFAQDRGWSTINGYSGNQPPDYTLALNCQDGIDDLAHLLDFQSRSPERMEMARRVVPIGYSSCLDPAFLMEAYTKAHTSTLAADDDLGASPCASWTAVRKDRPAGVAWAYEQWMRGYLSAAAHFATDRAARFAADRPTIFAWLDTFCRTHPNTPIATAGETLLAAPAPPTGAVR
jgi:hypothetical protein